MNEPPAKRRRLFRNDGQYCRYDLDADHLLVSTEARGPGGPLETSAAGAAALRPLTMNCLRHVLTFLTLVDLVRLSRTSRRFLHVVWEENVFWTGRLKVPEKQMTPRMLESMMTMVTQYASRINGLVVDHAPAYVVDALAHRLPHVKKLSWVGGYCSNPHSLHVLSQFSQLESLRADLSATTLPRHWSSVRSLELSCHDAGVADVLEIPWIPALTSLHVNLEDALSLEVATLASRCQQLQKLHLVLCEPSTMFGASDFEWCGKLNARLLRDLYIEVMMDEDVGFVDKWFEELRPLVNLQSLHFISSPAHANEDDDEDYEPPLRYWSAKAVINMMAAMPDLRSLWVDFSTTNVMVNVGDDDIFECTMDKCRRLSYFRLPATTLSSNLDVINKWITRHPDLKLENIDRLKSGED